MAGLFGILGVASRSMFTTQAGVRTAAHNVANVNTPGYSRQRQVLDPAPPFITGAGALGSGVEQRTIQRITDRFVQEQLVREDSSRGAARTQADVLSSVEELFNEQLGGGISAPLSSLYAAFSDLASATAPGAATERQAVLGAARSLIDAVQRIDAGLRDRQRIADRTAVDMLPRINALLQRIADLNQQIEQQEIRVPANDLRDQRERAVRELAGLVDVSHFEQDDGALVVFMAGGLTAVEGSTARQLIAGPDPSNPFDPTFSRILLDDGMSPQDVTGQISSGELGGLLRARDGVLPGAIRSLDVLAYNLIESVNAVHSAGVALDGTSGNFFVPAAAVEDAARNLALDPAVAADPDKIAAGQTASPGDNRNALALAALRDAAIALALPGDPPGPPSGPTRTLLDHAAAVVADVGQQTRTLKDAVVQHERVLEVLENRRDEVSGVSIDEEMTDLIQLQAAFQANARVVSVIDRLLQDVVAIL